MNANDLICMKNSMEPYLEIICSKVNKIFIGNSEVSSWGLRECSSEGPPWVGIMELEVMEGCEMMLEGRSEGSVEVQWDGCHFLKHVFRICHMLFVKITPFLLCPMCG